MRFSYAYLADKYLPDSKYTIEDRTYEGVIWHGPGDKPSRDLFDSLDKEEQRFLKVKDRSIELENNLLIEMQMAHRQKALDAVKPLEKKLEGAV